MAPPKNNKIDLDKLAPDQRTRVERALNPRDTALGTKHNRANIELWKRAAKEEGITLVEWVERKLNE